MREGRSKNRYYVREWKSLCEKLAGVTVNFTEIRKYSQSKTPDDVPINQTKVISKGSMTKYRLQNDEYAVIVAQKKMSNTSIKDDEIKLVFVESPAVFFKQQLHPNRWYRPKDVSTAIS